jgi:hypothetical protein
MNKLLSGSFGFLYCLLATYPAQAEALSTKETPPQQAETDFSVVADFFTDFSAVADFFEEQARYPTAAALNWSASANPKLDRARLDRELFGDRQIFLNVNENQAISPTVKDTTFLRQADELRRNRNYFWNVAQQFSMGVGVVDERAPVSLTSFNKTSESDRIWQEMPVTTRSQNGYDWKVNFDYKPLSELGINFNGNDSSSQFGLNWQPIPGISFSGTHNNQDSTIAGGLQIAQQGDGIGFTARANYDTQQRWRWGVNSQLGDLQLSYQSNGDPKGLGSNSQASYRLFGDNNSSSEYTLKVGYEIRDGEQNEQRLTTFGSKYRLGNNALGDPSRWEFDLGYGIGSEGRGLITSISAQLNTGLKLRASYQQISVTSDDETFKFELLPFSN